MTLMAERRPMPPARARTPNNCSRMSKWAGGDAGQGRGLRTQRPGERVPRGLRPPHLDVHPPAAVTHPTAKRVLPGQAIDKGPEAHALHDAVDVNMLAIHDAFQD